MFALPVFPLAFSQTPLAASPTANTSAPSAEVITLGNSAFALNGPWRFQPGDSPWANGSPVWAQPGFDDSRWATMDLTPKAGALDLMNGISGFVPGWTTKGYPDLSGYAWYRLRLRVKDAGQALWLKMPNDFDDAYQIYANGRYVGQYGSFSGNHVTLYYSEPASFALPAPGPDGEIDLAVRFYMSGATFFNGPDVGGMHGAPALGMASTVRLLQTSEDDALLHNQFGVLTQMFLYILVAPLALWAWLYNRKERAWMWLLLALAWSIIFQFLSVTASLTTLLTIAESTWLSSILLPFWTMFWWEWFGLREKKWIPRTLWLLAALFSVLSLCAQSPNVGLSFLPQASLHWFIATTIWVSIPYWLMVIVILVEGFRRDRIEALMAAIPIVLGMYSAYGTVLLNGFHIRNEFYPFGLGIAVANVVAMCNWSSGGAGIAALCAHAGPRVAVEAGSEEGYGAGAAIAAARARARGHRFGGFTVESEYRPAQTVGGDFFQTLMKPDGSLLVVIGDVSGKGVSAAMLVAVLVAPFEARPNTASIPR